MRFPWKSAPHVAHLMLRIALGATLVLIGISSYRNFAPFVVNLTDGLGPIRYLATAWSFVLPALLIFGGALLILGRYQWVAAWLCGLGVATVPVGLILKTVLTGLPLPATMAAGYPSIIWIVGLYFALNPPLAADADVDDESSDETVSS